MENTNQKMVKTGDENPVNRISELNPLKMSDADMKFARETCSELRVNHKELLDKAQTVVDQLGYGGLWRGLEASIVIVSKAIMEGN